MGEGKTSFSCSSSKPRGRIEDEDENEKKDEAAVHGKPPFVFRMHWDHEPDWHPSPCQAGRGWPKAGRGVVHGENSPNFVRTLLP